MKTSILILVAFTFTTRMYGQTHVDFDKSVNFKEYKTFTFERGRVVRQLGLRDTAASLINGYVKAAIEEQLTKKGLTQTANNPDLIVTFMAGAREKQDVHNTMASPGFFYPYYRFYSLNTWWGPQWNNFWVTNYEEGTLILDVIDSKTDRLVWRGYGVAPISRFDEEKFVEKELTKLLKQFPPAPKS